MTTSIMTAQTLNLETLNGTSINGSSSSGYSKTSTVSSQACQTANSSHHVMIVQPLKRRGNDRLTHGCKPDGQRD